MPPLFVPMEKEAISVGRCAHGRHSVLSGVGHNRRLPLGMGSTVAGQDCPGAVAVPEQHTHQRARAQCGAASTHPLFASVRRQARAGPIGQQVHCCPDQSPTGHSVRTASPGNSEPADLGISPPGQRAGSLHPWDRNQVADFLSRQKPPPSEWRLHPEMVERIWGPLCLRGIRPLPPLILLDGGDQPPRT